MQAEQAVRPAYCMLLARTQTGSCLGKNSVWQKLHSALEKAPKLKRYFSVSLACFSRTPFKRHPLLHQGATYYSNSNITLLALRYNTFSTYNKYDSALRTVPWREEATAKAPSAVYLCSPILVYNQCCMPGLWFNYFHYTWPEGAVSSVWAPAEVPLRRGNMKMLPIKAQNSWQHWLQAAICG